MDSHAEDLEAVIAVVLEEVAADLEVLAEVVEASEVAIVEDLEDHQTRFSRWESSCMHAKTSLFADPLTRMFQNSELQFTMTRRVNSDKSMRFLDLSIIQCLA